MPVNQTQSLKNLVNDINADRVDVLLILGGNPAYNAPSDLKLGSPKVDGKLLPGALQNLSSKSGKFTVHLSHYYDETSRLCQWHIPQAHYLEAWGDGRAFNGTTSIQQPLIVPLYNDARSPIELMATLLAPSTNAAIQTMPSGYEIVRNYWMSQRGGAGESFEKWWGRAVHDGMIAGTGLRPKTVTARNNFPVRRGSNWRYGNHVSHRSFGVGWSLWQQCMVAGIACAAHQIGVG